MAYSRPGVYISEGPFSTTAPAGTPITPAAFLGTAARGPQTATRVESWNQYKTLFGDLTNSYDLGYAVYQFFANGGRTAYVKRVYGATSLSASTTVYAGTVGGASASVDLFTFSAKSVGTWANYTAGANSSLDRGVQVVLSTGLRNGTSETVAGGTGTPATFNISVLFNGAEVERWQEVSLDPDASQYALTVVNNYSNYVTMALSSANVVPAGTSYTITGLNYASPAATVSKGLAGGTDETVQNSDWQASLSSLDTVPGQLLINLVGQSDKTKVDAALSYAEGRGNSFVIIDPSPTQTTSLGISGLVSTYNRSSYGAVYYPMVKMPDPAKSGSATLRDTYPGGAVAGLFCRVEAERTVAKAPAGYAYDLRNGFALAVNFTDTEVGTLYDENINTLKVVPGGGVIVNGARTLRKIDITKYVPVRRSLNYIKTNIEGITQLSLFEPNGNRVWTDINTRISRFLSDFWGAGGLKGRNATEAFYVVCDESNNPDYSIENGELHVEVGVALQAPAEFIVINISQFAGGTTNTAEAV